MSTWKAIRLPSASLTCSAHVLRRENGAPQSLSHLSLCLPSVSVERVDKDPLVEIDRYQVRDTGISQIPIASGDRQMASIEMAAK